MTTQPDIEQLLAFDRQHIWHPYSPAVPAQPCHLVESARGVYIQLASGEKLIDGVSSWWAVIHGYNHPHINKAIVDQLHKFSHVMFAGLTHQAAISLTRNLLTLVPANLQHVFYSDSGSVAVEIAMKMALQYWHAMGRSQKCTFATVRSGYHGDTWHAMSVCDPQDGMHTIFNNRLTIQHFAAEPHCRFGQAWDARDLDSVEALFEQHGAELAAFIIEPIVQGAGGMRFYHPEYLKALAALCSRYEVLLIADEIATGFGRTGRMFACEWAGVQPDIMTVGKGLTGGYVPMAATLASAQVGTVISQKAPGIFIHGPTFMGNPIAAAAANASLELIMDSPIVANVARIEAQLKQGLMPARDNPAVADVRVLGAIGVIEMKEAVDREKLQALFIANGVWARPFGKLVYLMPALIMVQNELEQLIRGVMKGLSAYAP